MTNPVDLLKFDGGDLYFDETIDPSAKKLVETAAGLYGQDNDTAEELLRRAADLAPRNLAVMVAQYRFYYYRHHYDKALLVAARVLATVGRRLNFPPSWRELSIEDMGLGTLHSMQLVRFYLFALKGCAYLNLRLGHLVPAREILEKICELDTADRIGVRDLLVVTRRREMALVPSAPATKLSLAEEV